MKKVINARMVVKPEAIEQFLSYAKTIVEKTNAETGCLFYKLYQEVGNPVGFIFYEIYKNQEAIEFHNSSDYLKAFLANTSGLLSENPIVEVY